MTVLDGAAHEEFSSLAPFFDPRSREDGVGGATRLFQLHFDICGERGRTGRQVCGTNVVHSFVEEERYEATVKVVGVAAKAIANSEDLDNLAQGGSGRGRLPESLPRLDGVVGSESGGDECVCVGSGWHAGEGRDGQDGGAAEEGGGPGRRFEVLQCLWLRLFEGYAMGFVDDHVVTQSVQSVSN